jgi:hypothetical protein
MQFEFTCNGYSSGYLAFIPSAATTATSGRSSDARRLLLVTDAGNNAVHLVDVVDRRLSHWHVGYVAPPGYIDGPRGVAVSGTSPLVAVSAWKKRYSGNHVVVVYRGSGTAWEADRVIGGGFGSPWSLDGQLDMPFGLRFTRDGSGLCVADSWNGRACLFRVGDGTFVRHMATWLGLPHDVEEVEGGWLVAGGSHTVEFVDNDASGDGGGDRPSFGAGRPSLGRAGGVWGSGHGELGSLAALAVVPGLGLVVREVGNLRLQVFATPNTIAMASMSHVRVAWMCVVARGVLRRQRSVVNGPTTRAVKRTQAGQ